MLRVMCFLLMLSCSGCSFAEQWQIIATEGQPHARHEASFVKHDKLAYLVGGRRLQPIDIFDPVESKWRQGATPPLEIHHFQAVAWQDAVYLVGGFTGGWPREQPVDRVLRYLPQEDRFEFTHTIPANRRRGSAGVVVYNDSIYVVGGIVNGHMDGHVAWFDRYDPKTGDWQQLPDAPRPRDHFQAVVIGDDLYLMAGRLSSQATNQPFERTIKAVDVFNFTSKTWRTLSPEQNLPTPRAGNMAVAVDQSILVIGGESGSQVPAHNEVEAFNIAQQRWQTRSPLAQGRHGTGVVEINGYLIVASGCLHRGGEPELLTTETLLLQK